MDFSISEKTARHVSTVRDFVDRELIPRELDFVRDGLDMLGPWLGARRDDARAMGLFAPHVAREHGGAGLTLLELAFVAEELGRTPLGHLVFNCQAPDAGNMEILARHGTPEQRERFLAPLVRGEVRSCFAMTEPELAGSNPVWLATTAVREGDTYRIDGHKWFTSGADGAAFAIVMAVTNPDAPKPHRRASQILVPRDAPGFIVVRNIPVMGEAGTGWASHAEVRFENCRVPIANRIGEEGEGFRLAQERLGPGRIHHCMRWVGIARRAFEMLCARAVSRELAPGDPLASRQIVQAWAAELKAEIDAARLLVLHAAWRIDREGAAAARDDVSAIKFLVAGVLGRALDLAIQVHGALGVTDDTPLAWWYRHERGARIYDGADEVHKTALARRLFARGGDA